MSLLGWLDEYDRRDWETKTSGTVRYALIGLGWWTLELAIPAIEATDTCETTVLVSSDAEKAEREAARNDISHGITYEDFHDGVAADEYDAVYIATPNAYHLEYAKTAAELDKAVLCEKPMEATIDRAEELVTACDSADVPLMVAYRLQTDPAVRRARELIEAGALGRPLYGTGTHSQPLLDMIPDPDQWRLDPDRTGYGTSVMDLGIYPINTARFLLDRDPIAATGSQHSEHEAFVDVPDQWATFALEFPEGITLVGTTSQHAQTDSSLTLTGTEGQIRLEPAFRGQVTLGVGRGDQHAEITHDRRDTTYEMTEEFAYFANRVLTGAPIEADGTHGLIDLYTIKAIHEAAETGERVEIESV